MTRKTKGMLRVGTKRWHLICASQVPLFRIRLITVVAVADNTHFTVASFRVVSCCLRQLSFVYIYLDGIHNWMCCHVSILGLPHILYLYFPLQLNLILTIWASIRILTLEVVKYNSSVIIQLNIPEFLFTNTHFMVFRIPRDIRVTFSPAINMLLKHGPDSIGR